MQPAVMTAEELTEKLAAEFPQAFDRGTDLAIEEVWHGGCRVRRATSDSALRPGGTVSGPTMMALADFTMYVALLGSIGWVPLAVTTALNINFLRKPAPGALLATCHLLKLGKRLAVGEVAIRSAGGEEVVAHATLTYAIPQR